ncbi:MAG: 3-methyladenine DNA glycosylase [Acidimicrobiia bacterium]|nr:MAG: 3-methyladenine DNA glycosylase [Acidimicrobiia bacterium]
MLRELEISGPFDLGSTTRVLKVGSRDRDGAWWWATQTSCGPGTIRVARTHGGVEAESWGPGGELLLDRLATLIGADDVVGIEGDNANVADLLRRSAATRLGATGAVFESTVLTVLGQLVTKTESTEARRRLVHRFGQPGPGPNQSLTMFPRPEVIAALTYDDLHDAGVERKRASTVIEVARRSKRLDEILGMDNDAARRRLSAVRGIGPWTTEIVMGVAYGDKDAVPPGDYHLPNSIAFALAGEARGDDQRMFELLEPYRPERRRVVVALKVAGVHAPRYGPKSAVRRHL